MTLAPLVTVTSGFTPASASLTLTTAASQLTLGVSPNAASLTLTTAAPVVRLTSNFAPATTSLTLTTAAPALMLVIGEMPATVLECSPGRLPRRAVWLSELQFAHAITQLLGPAALDAEQVPDPALKPFSQGGVVVTRPLLQKRLELAGRASASLEGRVAEATGCTANDDACARAFIATLAAKAFRRHVC